MAYNPLPLSQFINMRALADQATIENVLSPRGILMGEVNRPAAPVRSLDPNKQGPLGPWPPSGLPSPTGTIPWNVGHPTGGAVDVNSPQSPLAGIEVLASLGGTPPGHHSQQFPMQQGDFQEGPTYPHVQPDQGVGGGAQVQQPQQQQYQPSSQDFGVDPKVQQQQQNSMVPSDAGMWGLIAAGLGILANNYGNYGQAGPAIGKGGLIGVNTFLNQRQIGIENTRRDELAKQESARWEAQARLRNAQAAREEETYRRRQDILKKFKPENEAEGLLLELAPEKYAEMKLKKAEGFTLGAGEKRFDADAKEIAYNPKDPKVPEGMRLKPDGTYEWDAEYLRGKKEIGKAGASSVSVTQGKEYSELIAKQLDRSYERANSAITAQSTLHRLEKNLSNPDLIAGPLANKRLTLEQIKQYFGGGSSEALSVTRSTIQGLSELTLNSRGMLVGQGQITEKEQALLERARGGDIEMSVPELKELVSVLSRMQRAMYDAHTNTLEKAGKIPGSEWAKDFYAPMPFPEAPKSKPTKRYNPETGNIEEIK